MSSTSAFGIGETRSLLSATIQTLKRRMQSAWRICKCCLNTENVGLQLTSLSYHENSWKTFHSQETSAVRYYRDGLLPFSHSVLYRPCSYAILHSALSQTPSCPPHLALPLVKNLLDSQRTPETFSPIYLRTHWTFMDRTDLVTRYTSRYVINTGLFTVCVRYNAT